MQQPRDKNWKPTDEERAYYRELLKTIRMSYNDIGKIVGVSSTTVADVLKNDRTHFASSETVKLIFQAIHREAVALGEALNRLSGGSTG